MLIAESPPKVAKRRTARLPSSWNGTQCFACGGVMTTGASVVVQGGRIYHNVCRSEAVPVSTVDTRALDQEYELEI